MAYAGSLANVRSSGLGHVKKISKRTIGKRVHKRTYRAARIIKHEGKLAVRKTKATAIKTAKKSRAYQGAESQIIKHNKALKTASAIGKVRKAGKNKKDSWKRF
jgi:hypothetical protein